jgi:hypothetical protein
MIAVGGYSSCWVSSVRRSISNSLPAPLKLT